MNNSHAVYQLIHSLTTQEKTLFKKNQLSKNNSNSRTLIIIFDLLNKQKEYSLEKLLESKKISSTVKKGIHVWLNSLNKKIIQINLDYRRAKSNESHFYQAMEEYDFLLEKKLFELASKKINKLESFVVKNKMEYFKPFLYRKITNSLVNNATVKKEYKESQKLKFEESVEHTYFLGQVSINIYKFESLIENNGSLVFKDFKEVTEIKENFEKLLKQSNNEFEILIVINNNLLILNAIIGNLKGISDITFDFLKTFESLKHNLTEGEVKISLTYFQNLAKYNVVLENNSAYLALDKMFGNELNNLIFPNTEKDIFNYKTNDKSLFYFINPKEKVLEKDMDLFLKILEKRENTIGYYELLTTTSIVLANQKKYQQSLDLTNHISKSDFNERVTDLYVFIKLIRAICWYKLENIELFNSELMSVYNYVLKNQSFSYAKEIINFIKKITVEKLMKNRKKHLTNLYIQFEKIQTSGTLYQSMEAIELKLLLEIAL